MLYVLLINVNNKNLNKFGFDSKIKYFQKKHAKQIHHIWKIAGKKCSICKEENIQIFGYLYVIFEFLVLVNSHLKTVEYHKAMTV